MPAVWRMRSRIVIARCGASRTGLPCLSKPANTFTSASSGMYFATGSSSLNSPRLVKLHQRHAGDRLGHGKDLHQPCRAPSAHAPRGRPGRRRRNRPRGRSGRRGRRRRPAHGCRIKPFSTASIFAGSMLPTMPAPGGATATGIAAGGGVVAKLLQADSASAAPIAKNARRVPRIHVSQLRCGAARNDAAMASRSGFGLVVLVIRAGPRRHAVGARREIPEPGIGIDHAPGHHIAGPAIAQHQIEIVFGERRHAGIARRDVGGKNPRRRRRTR